MFFSIVRLAGESAVRPNTLFLNHLKWITGKKQVEKHFGRFGKITDVNIVFDLNTGLHKGYGSVTFENNASALAALKNRPHVIDGEVVGVEFLVRKNNNRSGPGTRY